MGLRWWWLLLGLLLLTVCALVLGILGLIDLVQRLLHLVLPVIITEESDTMGNAVVLQLVELVVVQDKSVWLPVDVHHLHRPWLVLVVKLLEELAVLLR